MSTLQRLYETFKLWEDADVGFVREDWIMTEWRATVGRDEDDNVVITMTLTPGEE